MRLVGIDDLGPERCRALLERAAQLADGAAPVQRPGAVLLAFFEPSTRTKLGFARAAVDVGATPVMLESTRFGAGTTVAESLSDTLAVASAYFEVVVLRHPEVPEVLPEGPATIVSGGLANEEHPTQALIDLAAVHAELGKLDRLRWGLVGDLRWSRCARSLLRALRWFEPAEVRLMSPCGREARQDVLAGLNAGTAGAAEIEGLDVIYVAGLPPGTGSEALDATARAAWRIDERVLGRLPQTARILCPLPRIDEIDPAIEADPRCAWLRQSARGRFVRTAVLEACWPQR